LSTPTHSTSALPRPRLLPFGVLPYQSGVFRTNPNRFEPQVALSHHLLTARFADPCSYLHILALTVFLSDLPAPTPGCCRQTLGSSPGSSRLVRLARSLPGSSREWPGPKPLLPGRKTVSFEACPLRHSRLCVKERLKAIKSDPQFNSHPPVTRHTTPVTFPMFSRVLRGYQGLSGDNFQQRPACLLPLHPAPPCSSHVLRFTHHTCRADLSRRSRTKTEVRRNGSRITHHASRIT
jgi:hypothetical protein